MKKYTRIINLFKELTDELSSLSKLEYKTLILGLEQSILTDKMRELELEKRRRK